MKRILTFATASAISAFFAVAAAQANDYNSGVVTKTPSEGFTDVEFGSGWYLRGDISYNIDGRDQAGNFSVTTPSTTQSAEVDYDDAVGVRIGAGYYVAPNVRAEVNVESLFNSSFSAVNGQAFDAIIIDGGGIAFPTTTGGIREVQADYQAATLIASANVDIGTYGAFTPYVGLGAGIARVEYNETETLTCVPFATNVSCADRVFGGPGEEVQASRTFQEADWTYAYQLTAGTAVAVDDRTSLDFSYSFTQIGDGDTLSYADGTAIDEDGVRLHQIRAGVRYEIW
ncbi:MAG: outer membrane beta-barrel protein [Rhizobiaceae bacterium]|nr:outer membrane beta-barrel protein [Rhizobiaceae bacterium]